MDIPDKKRKIPPQRSSPVKKSKSRILIILAAGLAGLLILIMAVLLSIDPNNFREPVIQVLTRATGLDINIESLDWSFSRGLQFKCKGAEHFSKQTHAAKIRRLSGQGPGRTANKKQKTAAEPQRKQTLRPAAGWWS